MYNIGIIGTGGIAHMHARGIIKESDILNLKAVCDIDKERLNNFAEKYNVSKVYVDYKKVLHDQEIDAVIISLPHNLHEQIGIECLKAGKHVLIEKPITRNLHEADNLIKAARETGKILMVGHNQRYYPIYKKIYEEILEQNILGEIFCARIDHYQNFNTSRGSWWQSKEEVGGGCVIGSGIHRLDILRWYLGEVEEVFAYEVNDKDRLEAEVATVASIKFKKGAIAEFLCNWGVYRSPYAESLSIFGKNGSIYLNNKDSFQIVLNGNDGLYELKTIKSENKYESMWRHFAICISTKTTPFTNAIEGRKSLELVLAIDLSAKTGKPVKLPL